MPVPPATGDQASALAPCARPGNSRRSWFRTWSAIAGLPGRTKIDARAAQGPAQRPDRPGDRGAITGASSSAPATAASSSFAASSTRFAARSNAKRHGRAQRRRARGPPIEFRIGIHLGDVVEESDGDLMGDGVNIAARLEGIAKPGAICLSGARLLAGARAGSTWRSPISARPQLKNIAEPVRAYSLEVGVPAQAKPAEPVTPAAPTPQKRRFGLAPLAAALAALLIMIAAGAWWFLNANRPASVAANAPAEAARLSIVVLPFANLSGDPGQDYLVDALTDELTTSLARMRDTFVIARNTAMTFKGKPVDVKAIGKDLGVRYVLEGSVQPSGDRMRVNAQLIDAGSGAHLWAEQFDTPRADLLQTQDAIVAHLANTLDLQLQQAYVARVKRTPAANRDAEDLALQCSAGAWKAGSIGKEADAAYALCEQALAIDPNNVRALMVLGVKFSCRRRLAFPATLKATSSGPTQLEFEGARPRSGLDLASRLEGQHPSGPGARRGSRRRARARARPGPVQRGRRRRPGLRLRTPRGIRQKP